MPPELSILNFRCTLLFQSIAGLNYFLILRLLPICSPLGSGRGIFIPPFHKSACAIYKIFALYSMFTISCIHLHCYIIIIKHQQDLRNLLREVKCLFLFSASAFLVSTSLFCIWILIQIPLPKISYTSILNVQYTIIVELKSFTVT